MHPSLKFIATVFLSGILITLSCKKEYSCENCIEKNLPPVAKAGPDQIISLPKDSVSLDGSNSTDADGRITNYQWRKISGPSSINILNGSDAITLIKNLAEGLYEFELKVTDDGGLSGKDTVLITLISASIGNRPPVANAGDDQVIFLPDNSVILDGARSTDPDNNITTYVWKKISGPLSSSITSVNTILTQVTNLTQGICQIELTVTDAGGLFSKDTVQVTVNAIVTAITPCDSSTRQIINAQLVPIGILSQGRHSGTVAVVGNKILFAGGAAILAAGQGATPLSNVDIYDINTNTWSTAQLSQPRWYLTSAVLGNKVYFAGGVVIDNIPMTNATSRIDIYNASNNTWSVSELPQPRMLLASAVLGSKIFFASGNSVDIFDGVTGSWSTQNLSEFRYLISVNTIGNKIYFAGGISSDFEGLPSSKIDIYDGSTNSWSTSSLSQSKYNMASTVIGNTIIWAGGSTANSYTNEVEIKDINIQTTTLSCLFQHNSFKYNSVGVKNNQIVFFTGEGLEKNKFDIYDVTTNSWSIGVLNQNIYDADIISVNNIIYVAGGFVNGVLSNNVWKLVF